MFLMIHYVKQARKHQIQNHRDMNFQNNFLKYSFSLITGRIARSITEETKATLGQIPRESQITSPQSPSITVRQGQGICSFFDRRHPHWHRHHHRQPHQS